jgi:ribosome maturation protein SDO1
VLSFYLPRRPSSFAFSPNFQALKVIKKLIEHFPIKRAPLTVRFTAPKSNLAGLMEKLDEWNAIVISKDESGSQSSLVSLIDYVSPSHYRVT